MSSSSSLRSSRGPLLNLDSAGVLSCSLLSKSFFSSTLSTHQVLSSSPTLAVFRPRSYSILLLLHLPANPDAAHPQRANGNHPIHPSRAPLWNLHHSGLHSPSRSMAHVRMTQQSMQEVVSIIDRPLDVHSYSAVPPRSGPNPQPKV